MWRTERLQENICGTAPAVPLLPFEGPRRVALAREEFVPVRRGETVYYGGDQSWFREDGSLCGAWLAETGCGAAAVVNMGWYLTGGGELDCGTWREQFRRVVRRLWTPVLRAGRLGRGVARFVRGMSHCRVTARVLRNRSTGLEEALRMIERSLARDRPVAMQVLRSRFRNEPGAEHVIPWHWTVITSLTFDPSEPEQAVCTCSRWGERRQLRFARAWQEKKGLCKRVSLVLFDDDRSI